jgi:hypothetical protein
VTGDSAILDSRRMALAGANFLILISVAWVIRRHSGSRGSVSSARQIPTRINNLRKMEDNHMNTIEHDDDSSTDDKLNAQRDIIRQSLNEIANDIGMAMRDVGLTFPLYITVRNSGDSLVTIATPVDPSDTDWQQASAIVCRTLEGWTGCDRLRGRELACAIANAGAINAADVTAD